MEGVALRILFVCTGNLCRSPIAERLATAYAEKNEIHDLQATSAGTQAMPGSPIAASAVQVLKDLGGDPSGFASQRLTAAIATDADLILTMTKEQRDEVLRLAPARLHRTFLLSEASRLVSECDAGRIADLSDRRPHLPAHKVVDIPDPIGRSEAVFTSVGRQIADFLPPVLELCRHE